MENHIATSGFKEKLTFGSIILIIGALISIAGSFLAWATMGVFSISGFTVDGKITAIGGVLILFLIVFVYNTEKKRSTITAALSFLASITAIVVTIYDGTNLQHISAAQQLFTANIGIGLYLTFLGGLLSGLGSIAIIANINKQNFYRLGSLSRRDIIKVIVMSVILLLSMSIAYAAARSGHATFSEQQPQPAANISTKKNEPEEKPELKLVSKYAHKSDYGSDLIISGEVKNVGNVDAYEPDITVSLLSKGAVVASTSYGEIPQMIPKDMVVPYEAQISNAPAYDDIKIDIKAKGESYEKYQYLTVVGQNPRTDQHSGIFESLNVAGELQNTANVEIGNMVEVFAWLLDSRCSE